MRKKGVSPLIATVLLIVFTVAISTIVVSWLRDYTSDTTSSVSDTGQEVIECAKQNLKISNTYITVYTATGISDIKATLRNTGSVNFTISSAYVYNTTGDFCDMMPSITLVTVGGVVNLANNTCDILTATSDFNRVEVTTTCGISTDFVVDDKPTLTSVP